MRMLIALTLSSWLVAVLFVLYMPPLVLASVTSFLAGMVVTVLIIARVEAAAERREAEVDRELMAMIDSNDINN